MSRQILHTPNAPDPIGPYSQAVWAGNLLFLSGQIAINPKTKQLAQLSLEIETHQVMKNIAAILEKAGLNFGHVIKTSIFLKNMDDFSRINTVYGGYFQGIAPPARETVQVSRLPKDVNIEISIIAMK